MSQVQKSSRLSVDVDATIEQVWEVVSDVTRVGEWSHECRSARWLGRAQEATPGARFRGSNRAGWLRWARTSEILRVDPPHEIVWRTVPTLLVPDSTEWSIRLEEQPTGTRVTQSFRVLKAPWLLDRLYASLVPTHQDRDERLTQDLERLGAVARRRVLA